MKLNMGTAETILFVNYKLHSKNAMKHSIGLSC